MYLLVFFIYPFTYYIFIYGIIYSFTYLFTTDLSISELVICIS